MGNSKVSVIMGIYNCESTLEEAAVSIFHQTFTNWELIMCDDGSTDRTLEVAKKLARKRPGQVRVIRNRKNLGLNQTLNHCLKYAAGDYVARMDGDDISLPERLQKEVEFLDAHPEIAIVSTPMHYFDQSGIWGTGTAVEYPRAVDFVKGTPFCHAPCMVRRTAYEAVGGYSTDKRTLRAEDYDLWFRMYARGFRGANLQTPYYKMRDDLNAYHRRKFRYSLNEAYVKRKGFRLLNLPRKYNIWILRPVLVAILPKPVYMALHHQNMSC